MITPIADDRALRVLAVAAMSLALAVFACSARAQDDAQRAGPPAPGRVTSPDGRTVVEVFSTDGAPRYRVLRDGAEIIAPSRLGVRFAAGGHRDAGDVRSVAMASRDTSWEQPWGERRMVRDHHNELLAVIAGDGRPGFSLRVRAFNDGVAFRYEVTDLAAEQTEIVDELTEFRVAPDSRAWWIPAAFANRYEYLYQTTPLSAVHRAHTPLTLQIPGGPYLAIHEAALADYAGMWINQRRDGVLTAELAPWSDGVKVKVKDGFVTPWRTIQLADDAVGLINSDLILNLNEPNVLGDVSWVTPGKYVGVWWGMHLGVQTWGSGPDHGATTAYTQRMIDFAAEHGFNGVLVEGWNVGWDGDWFANGDVFKFTQAYPDFDLEGLAAYARDRGVRLIGHHETSGGITNYEAQLADAFDLYERLGVAIVKTGYVADAGELVRRDEDGAARYEWHDGQFAVNHHLRVVREAAARRIAINPHEPVKDTGLRRTYPNWVSREGARGQEYNAWGEPVNPPEHVPLLAFTRMLSGPFDHTPGIFDLEFVRPEPDGRAMHIQSTLARQLALYVVIYSPIQMAADLPEHYEARPDAFQFIKDVPTDWETSVALEGDIGDFVAIARRERGGEDWYLGAVTDEHARVLELSLDFLDSNRGYRATVYRDGDGAHWESAPYAIAIEERAVTADDTLRLPLAAGGGAAVRFTPRVATP